MEIYQLLQIWIFSHSHFRKANAEESYLLRIGQWKKLMNENSNIYIVAFKLNYLNFVETLQVIYYLRLLPPFEQNLMRVCNNFIIKGIQLDIT